MRLGLTISERQGRAVHIAAIRDITERKRIEKHLSLRLLEMLKPIARR